MGSLEKEWLEFEKTLPEMLTPAAKMKFKEVFYLGAVSAMKEAHRKNEAITDEEKKAIEKSINEDVVVFLAEMFESIKGEMKDDRTAL